MVSEPLSHDMASYSPKSGVYFSQINKNQSSQMQNSFMFGLELHGLEKILNIQQIKLDYTNYMYWKAHIIPTIQVLDLENVIFLLSSN